MNSQSIICDQYQYRNQSISTLNPFLSIYIHIPFCTSMCTYCAFNTYARIEHLIPAFIEALKTELTFASKSNPYPDVGTIFFGGGTPSLLTPNQFKAILDHISAHFTVLPNAEISTEANPNDLSVEYLSGLRDVGINRLSIGMQSSNNTELKFFARRHHHQGLIEAVHAARQAGFDNINLDLIYGFPTQTLETWQQTLADVLLLDVEHLSLYALGLEPDTPLNNWVENGLVSAPDDDLAADMYDYATEALQKHGYEQYEISNWSKSGLACRHNLQYWRALPYIGIGPGAHGFAGGIRYSVERAPQKYINLLQAANIEDTSLTFPLTPAVDDYNILSRDEEISETLIMCLRLLNDGVHLADFKQRFEVDFLERYEHILPRFANSGLLTIGEDTVKLTKAGRLLCNLIFRELV
jgi:oxygen-independent coproporphyrinogen-3 oxidase